jgi:hypothetical protein
MKSQNLCVALMAVGLLMAAPAFAQTTPARKQPTQEGGPSMPLPITQPYNANPSGDPNYKQRTQEGGGSSMPMPCGAPFNANPGGDPDCKQRTQNLAPTPGQATFEATGKQK